MAEHGKGSQKNTKNPGQFGSTKGKQSSTKGAETARGRQGGGMPAGGTGIGGGRPEQDDQRGGMGGGKIKDPDQDMDE